MTIGAGNMAGEPSAKIIEPLAKYPTKVIYYERGIEQ